jgi:hypothetical protein
MVWKNTTATAYTIIDQGLMSSWNTYTIAESGAIALNVSMAATAIISLLF